MSLYNLIKSLDLNTSLSKPELYSNIKLISDYLIPNLSSTNKSDLINIISGLKTYLSNHNTKSSFKYNFSNQIITLDPEQLSVVNADPDLNMRIIAGAGSGKTTTILCRIKYILDNFTTPDRILILTFNRDSAQNIRNRVVDLFGFPIDLKIYTIDAFCYKLMNYYNYDSDVKLYSVSEYSHTGLNLMKKYGKEISSQYKYIFFDEFQDVNDVQFLILKIFVDNGCVLTVIGDDCQNIYQFR
jgi:superfamily I DNA/RNA helicase